MPKIAIVNVFIRQKIFFSTLNLRIFLKDRKMEKTFSLFEFPNSQGERLQYAFVATLVIWQYAENLP